ncbi:MAG: glycosyltransferase family 4 protein [Leptospiraceae bacterium]|nr:glycosyltransferase family 4 protein [Leptospiraceae bacterium]MCP5494623.1 glycosyltransferase family 4 protein [Leptospiraceae bacterium]
MDEYTLGINISGYINSEFGLGEAVRSSIRSIEVAGIPYVLNNFDLNQHRKEDKTHSNFTDKNPYPVNLILINPDMLGEFVKFRQSSYFQGKYNIGYWFWELNNFPKEWIKFFDLFDEIWTGSKYSMDAISKSSTIPTLTVPCSIKLDLASKEPEFIQNFENKYVFLYVFDFASSFQRKNPDKVIRAFLNTFQGNNDAVLVVKFSNSKQSSEKKVLLNNLINSHTNIYVIDDYLHRPDLLSLFQRADCYVSLHAAEGFGLTMAESMFLEKPVIATAYSANMDFMNVNNSFLVKYNLVEIKETDGLYVKGELWAEPDEKHCSELMRYVYENQEKAKEAGKQAKLDIIRNFSDHTVGNLIKKRLKRIEEMTDNFTAISKEDRSKYKIVNAYGMLHDLHVKNGALMEQRDVFHIELQTIRLSVVWRIRNLFITILNKLKLTQKTSL